MFPPYFVDFKLNLAKLLSKSHELFAALLLQSCIPSELTGCLDGSIESVNLPRGENKEKSEYVETKKS